MATEAQKRASRKYMMAHREYYSVKSNESAKRMRRERKMYRKRCEDAAVLLHSIYMLDNVTITNNACEVIDDAIKILEGDDDE